LRRRSSAVGSGSTVFEFGKIRVDLGKRIVELSGKPLHLTPIEYRLLAYLITHPDSVLTHRQLLKTVWGPSHADDSHYVRVYMGLLRKKIEDDPSQPRHIITEAGVGYRFISV
jgi:two-component system KDP operon response regulator KdpE